MSKAFTREDDLPDPMAARRLTSPLPPGAKNYITPDGARRLQEELDRLIQMERPRGAVAGHPGGAGTQLPVLSQRIECLQQSLRSAVIVNPPTASDDRVRFGATVRVRERSGEESYYRIVGIDETDLDRGWVSWISPVARALLNARRGERVRLKLPSSEQELEIVEITYP